MKHLMLLPLLLIIFSSLNAQYIPPHRDGVSQADYDKWVRRIKFYYEKLNSSEVLSSKTQIGLLLNYSTAYYTLKEPTDSSLFLLQKAMLVDKKIGCEILISYTEMVEMLPNGIPLEQRMSSSQWQNLVKDCGEILAKKANEKALFLEKEYEDNRDIYDFELIEQLSLIMEKDQKFRKNLGELKINHYQDSLNLAAVKKIIQEYGYPGKSLVGSKCETYAMWIIHHADNSEVRYKYFPLLYKAVQNNELDAVAFKFFIDRIHHTKFGTQLYGTQSQYNEVINAYERVPIEDEENYKQRIQDFNNGIIDIGRLSL